MTSMGNTSSQLAPELGTQSEGAAATGPDSSLPQAIDQLIFHATQDDESATPAATPRNNKPRNDGRGARKLKIYSAKKKRSSASKAKAAEDNENDDDDDAAVDGQDQVVDSTPVAGAGAEAEVEPEAEGSASQAKSRRERVTRNKAFLESIRSSQSTTRKTQTKARRSKGADADAGPVASSQQALAEGENEEGLPTPPYHEQIPDELKVSTWLTSRGGSAKEVQEAQNGEANKSTNGYGALLHNVNGHPDGADAPEEDEDEDEDEDEAEDDVNDYEVPSDSGDEFAPEPEPVKAAKTKARRASKTTSKRKREETPEPRAPSPPKKRKRNSEVLAPAAIEAARAEADDNPANFPSAGNFTATEIKLVDAAFDAAQEANNFSRDQMIDKIQASAAEAQSLLTAILTDILPNRNRKALQRFCRRHFNNTQRGKWTKEQDALLSAAQAEKPNKWVWIGSRVGRWPEDCRDRWRNFLALGEARHTDIWTRDEEVALAKAISESLAAIRERLDRDLTAAEEDEYIAWPVIIQKMGGMRNRLQCANKWKKIRQQASKEKNGLPLPDPLSPQQHQREKAAAKARFKAMKFGDLHAMLKEMEYGNFIGQIDHGNSFWSAVTRMHPTSPYNTQDRKMVYKKLRSQIDDADDFHENVSRMITLIETNFSDLMHERLHHEDEAGDSGDKKSRKNAKPKGGSSRMSAGRDFTSAERVEESDSDDAHDDVDEQTTQPAHQVAGGAEMEEEDEHMADDPAIPESEDEQQEDDDDDEADDTTLLPKDNKNSRIVSIDSKANKKEIAQEKIDNETEQQDEEDDNEAPFSEASQEL
ncbi:hypothetical protein AAFC00_001239 [Neodothiora populina]|uniref:DNA-binding protein REB1 n=1 Tax=Neodothiora populina TaxID=2781224 RepID=A0ABR3PNI8_9PEZI